MSGTPAKHLELYRLIMTEIKERCTVLRIAAEQKLDVWPVATFELGYLQIRLICELMGLGCLTAHGDIQATYSKRLFQTYEPGRIFAELGKLHPNFFPRACSSKITNIGGITDIEVLEDNRFLSKEEIIAIHGKTGNVLHRGDLKSIGRPLHLNFQELLDWHNKIVDMLRIHLISLHDINRYVLIIMNDPHTGAVGAAEIQATHLSEVWRADQVIRRTPKERKERSRG
jgi:hypothetical protein